MSGKKTTQFFYLIDLNKNNRIVRGCRLWIVGQSDIVPLAL